MLRKRFTRRLPKGLIPFIVITVLLFFILEGFLHVEKKLRPLLLTFAEIEANWTATDAINTAVMDKVARGLHYRDLIKMSKMIR